MKTRKIKNPLKFTLQTIIVVLLGYMLVRWGLDKAYTPDFEAYCPFGGLQAYLTYLNSGTLACSMSLQQIAMGIALAVGIIIFSKLFCGYICPLGTFSEWLGKLGDKWKKRREITGITDKVLRSLKYVLFFITVYFTVGSSELFCKNYDPFFATFTLFDHDVTVWMATLSIIIFIIGSIFYRFFWCKYLCPLGAISNIFKFFIMFAGVVGLYLILVLLFNIEISVVWPLAVVSVAGYVLEIRGLKSKVFPLVKITKDSSVCTNCRICDKSCPQGIKVSEYEKVDHIDCNLCGDCLNKCPEDGALGLNHKKTIKWLPAVITILLIILGIYFGSTTKLATIDLEWGEEEKIKTAEVYTRSGLKNINCYGSSMAFAQQMQQVKGILGVATYANSNGVEILYDPDQITEEKITEKIFASVKIKIQEPDSTMNKFDVVKLGINNYFDKSDAVYLREKLRQFGNVYGFETKFGEPVETKLYIPEGETINLDDLKQQLEKETLTYSVRGNEYTYNVNFEVVSPELTDESVDVKEFEKLMYPEYYREFNEKNKYSREELDIYQIPMQLVDKQTAKIMYIQNYLQTQEKGIVAIESYIEEENPLLRIYYVKDTVDEDFIYNEITKDSIDVRFSSGEVKKLPNMLIFKSDGEILD